MNTARNTQRLHRIAVCAACCAVFLGLFAFNVAAARTFKIQDISGNDLFSVDQAGDVNVTGNIFVQRDINASNINATTSRIYRLNVTESLVLGWTNLTNYPASCSPGDFVTAVGDTLTCAAPGETSSAAGGWTNTTSDTTSLLNVHITTGYLSLGNNLNISGSINLTGEIRIAPSINLTQDGNIVNNGTISTQGVTVRGDAVQLEPEAWKLANYSAAYAATGFDNENATVRFGVDYAAKGFNNENATTRFGVDYAAKGYKIGNLSANLAAGLATTIVTTTFTADTVTVNENLYIIGNISNVNVNNINVNGSILPSIDNQFALGNGSFRWASANISGTLQAGTLVGTFSGDGSGLDNVLTANNITFVNATSNFGGEVSGTYTAITLSDTALDDQYVLRENASLVQAGNTTYVTSQSVGGEVSGTVGSITLSDTALDDQYVLRENASLIQAGNTSWAVDAVNTQYPSLDTDASDDWNLANYSAEYASTGFKIANMTIAYPNLDTDSTDDAGDSQWNATGGAVYLNDTTLSVGIGTPLPTKKLQVQGTADGITFDPDGATPTINTTSDDLTITSATGDVIIMLG